MPIRQTGFTRASSLGPIVHILKDHGIDATRVLEATDIPAAILDEPDTVLPLSEQFRVLAHAARATGERHFGAYLGQSVRISQLSAFGKWVADAPSLAEGINRANTGLNTYLQTETTLRLTRTDKNYIWSMECHDPACDGRLQHELLGVFYLIDTVRAYVGPEWLPRVVYTTAPQHHKAGNLERIYKTNVALQRPKCAIEIETHLIDERTTSGALDKRIVRDQASSFAPQSDYVPSGRDQPDAIRTVTALAALGGYPRVEWVAQKLGLSVRTLHRRLQTDGTTFNQLCSETLAARAKKLLAAPSMTITEIAFELGYGDPAHFSRAFKRWCGESPTAYRRSINFK